MQKGIKKLLLTEDSRSILMNAFPPKFNVACSHVTIEHGFLSDEDISEIKTIHVIGYQSTGYLEVFVISVNGNPIRKTDKELLHITHSLNNVAPVCANDVLRELLYEQIEPMELTVEPSIVLFS
jgi:hypothetical protein